MTFCSVSRLPHKNRLLIMNNQPEQQRLQYLLSLYASNVCTREEMDELFMFLRNNNSSTSWNNISLHEWNNLEVQPPAIPVNWDDMFDHIVEEQELRREPEQPAGKVRSFKTWMAAAAVLAAAMTGFWLWNSNNATTQLPQPHAKETTIKPGADGAILTLADGSQVVLDTAANGLIATQSNAAVIKKNGQLVYQNGNDEAAEPAINLLTTPRGRQYRLMLPDGTSVWLNAGSSIRYPAFFKGTKREVTVSGEAYFEVAQGAKQPFMVNTAEQTIEVLGTAFNINTYDNEPAIRTTLLEGAISVKPLASTDKKMLRPGQQTVMERSGNRLEVKEVDAAQAIAWKNGMFRFDHATIPDVMRQLERWYDVEVTYQGTVPRNIFGGKIERNLPLAGVLKFLEESGVTFKTEGRHITVLSQ